jgi:hypothetical protein
MATLETRISDMEKKAGIGSGVRPDRIRLVGIERDGTEGERVAIKVPPILKNGKMDFSGFTDAEVRAVARIRIEDAD